VTWATRCILFVTDVAAFRASGVQVISGHFGIRVQQNLAIYVYLRPNMPRKCLEDYFASLQVNIAHTSSSKSRLNAWNNFRNLEPFLRRSRRNQIVFLRGLHNSSSTKRCIKEPVCSFHTWTPTISALSNDRCVLIIERSPVIVSLTTSGSGTESSVELDRVGLGIVSKGVESFMSKSSISRSTRYDRPFSSVRKFSCRTIQSRNAEHSHRAYIPSLYYLR
jgi:hypothetical protein